MQLLESKMDSISTIPYMCYLVSLRIESINIGLPTYSGTITDTNRLYVELIGSSRANLNVKCPLLPRSSRQCSQFEKKGSNFVLRLLHMNL